MDYLTQSNSDHIFIHQKKCLLDSAMSESAASNLVKIIDQVCVMAKQTVFSTKADVKTVGIGEVIKKFSPNDIFNCDKLIYLGGWSLIEILQSAQYLGKRRINHKYHFI